VAQGRIAGIGPVGHGIGDKGHRQPRDRRQNLGCHYGRSFLQQHQRAGLPLVATAISCAGENIGGSGTATMPWENPASSAA
jgi:hypothetical protein